jgi:energy-converting hydrogenase B subunit D
MTTVIIAVLGAIMIVAAVLAIYQKSLLSAIIAAGAISLLASVIYLILAAPDVAMTEAAIGSGLTTIVFLFALNKVRKQDKNG